MIPPDDTYEDKNAKKFKTPPITVHGITDFPAFLALIIKNSPVDNPTATKILLNDNVKVLIQTDDEYQRNCEIATRIEI